MELKRSAKLQQLIDQCNEERAKISKRRQKSEKQAEDIEAELAETKRELEKAMDATLELSNEANLKRERELRRKVVELELDLKGAQARKGRAFHAGSAKATAIANQAVELAKKEAQEAHDKHIDEIKQRIEDAKYEYLKSLVEYHQFAHDVNSLFYDTARDVGVSNPNGYPSVEVLYPFTGGGFHNFYGVLEHEVKNAYKHGKIGRFSVREGRTIE